MSYTRPVDEATDATTGQDRSGDGVSEGLAGFGDFDPETGTYEWYEPAWKSFGAVVGENVKRLREAKVLTQHELIHQWRTFGLNWARSKLAALENGHRPQVSGGEIVLMALGLGVPESELFAGPGDVRLDPAPVRISRKDLRARRSGEAAGIEYHLDDPKLYREAAAREDAYRGMAVEADGELAKRLGVPLGKVAKAASQIFNGLTLTAERDRRVERMGKLTAAERQAHRGHITRELSQQVEERIAKQDQQEG